MLSGGGRGGVADRVCSERARDLDTRCGWSDQRALARAGLQCADGVLDQVGAGLEVARRVTACGGDVSDLVSERISGEVGVDNFDGLAADDCGDAAGVAAGGDGFVDVSGQRGRGRCVDLDGGEFGIDACAEVWADRCGPRKDGERIAAGGHVPGGFAGFGSDDGAEPVGRIGRQCGGQITYRAVELEDQVPGLAENGIERGVRGGSACGRVLVAVDIGCSEEKDQLVDERGWGSDRGR